MVFATLVTTTTITLPGGPPASIDYIAFDGAHDRLWVPAGNTGKVDVIDTRTQKVTAIDGFATAPSPRPGRPNMGPSSAAVGDGVVWIGNRADKSICAFDQKTLAKGACVTLQSMPDGIVWSAATRELWVTTPRDQTITIVELGNKTPGAAPVQKTIKLDGDPEGYAIDGDTFYTNLEDKDKTLAIDMKTRKVVSTWSTGCGKEGPRGLVIDKAKRWLLVACASGAVTLDLAHGGKELGRIATGGGVDNIDYTAEGKLLYLAAGQDGMLTIARVESTGQLTPMEKIPTGKGARTVMLDNQGTAYVADSQGGRLVVVKAPAPQSKPGTPAAR